MNEAIEALNAQIAQAEADAQSFRIRAEDARVHADQYDKTAEELEMQIAGLKGALAKLAV